MLHLRDSHGHQQDLNGPGLLNYHQRHQYIKDLSSPDQIHLMHPRSRNVLTKKSERTFSLRRRSEN